VDGARVGVRYTGGIELLTQPDAIKRRAPVQLEIVALA
jgi:hypothetical protein